MPDVMKVTNKDLVLDPSKPAYIVKQKPMQSFTFENHLGDTFTAKADNGLDLMEDANEAILWSNWKDGMWNQVSDTKFVWVLGNFFD